MQPNFQQMRLHRNLVLAVIDGLFNIFNKGEYADKEVAILLKRDKRWGARDRAFIAETVYDLVRWRRLYAYIAGVGEHFDRPNLWKIFAVWAVLRGYQLPKGWKQIEGTPVRRIKGRFEEARKTRVLRESIPDWLDELGINELGEKVWEQELTALNQQAEVVLRTNTLKLSPKQLQLQLKKEGVDTLLLKKYPLALQLKERANVFKTSAFKEGFFEVQDASSQLVAEFLNVAPGMRVVDACAGAGGKALHLASLMKNQGQVIAMDVYHGKLKELKRRARRNGAHNIETRLIEGTKTIKKLHEKADRVLIDAPCSGLGVLRRNPDAKWKLRPSFVQNIKETQQDILLKYSKMVKPGGKLVYATCSILPSENQQQVERFLTSDVGKEFTFVKDKKILASRSGYDGFYLAQLGRNPK